MHIHLDSYVGARPNFADAPLYLSYGITTVLNLRGLPEHLEWRRRIQDGELLAPTLYTAGEFINEPRVRTPDEVEREVIRQFRAGYDVLKYHPIVDTQTGRDISTEGLQAPAFARMMETARRLGIPVIGHAPASLPLRIVLQEHESLAHMNRRSKAHIARSATTSGEFVHVYFFPLGLFILSLLGWSMASAIEYVRKRATTRFSFHRFRSVSLIFAATALLSLGLSVALILSGNVPLLALDSLLVLGLGVLAVAMTALGVRAWRLKDGPVLANLTLAVISLAGSRFSGVWATGFLSCGAAVISALIVLPSQRGQRGFGLNPLWSCTTH